MILLEKSKEPKLANKNVQHTHAKMARPFVASDAGEYVHRVRSVTVYTVLGKSHMAVRCWCGMTQLVSKRKKGRLLDVPTAGRPMCATCEGRVIGAGEIGARKINGMDVRYKPNQQANYN